MVLDPYEDHYVPGFPPLRLTGDLVLCSHQHNDHNAAEIVTLRTGRPNPFRITKIPTFHDPEGGRLRGENTIHPVSYTHLCPNANGRPFAGFFLIFRGKP